MPWIFEGARPLANPVPYKHKPGSQSRIILDEETARAVLDQIPAHEAAGTGSVATPAPPARKHATPERSPAEPPRARSAARGWIEGERAFTVLTQGNIDNAHFSLRPILDFFPPDAIGGSDRTQIARALLELEYEGVGRSTTDITGRDRRNRPGTSNHCFFRERQPIKGFFKATEARPGDIVVIERAGPFRFRISLQRGSSS